MNHEEVQDWNRRAEELSSKTKIDFVHPSPLKAVSKQAGEMRTALLVNAEQLHKAYPETFHTHDWPELEVGDFAKLSILGERFWAEIETVHGDVFTGRIDNEIVGSEEINLNDSIQFHRSNILWVMRAEDAKMLADDEPFDDFEIRLRAQELAENAASLFRIKTNDITTAEQLRFAAVQSLAEADQLHTQIDQRILAQRRASRRANTISTSPSIEKPRTNIMPAGWAGTAQDVEEEPIISDEQNDRTAKQVAELNETINKIKENRPANHDGMPPDEWSHTVELLVALEQLDIWLGGGAAEVVEEEYLRSAEQKIAKASEYIATKNAEYFQNKPSLLEFQTVYRIDEQFKQYENGPSRDWSRTLKAGTKAAFPELDIVELFKIGGAFDLRRNLESLLILAYLRHTFRNRKLFLQDQDTGHEKEKRAPEERAAGDDIYDVTIIGGGAAIGGSAAALFEAITSAAKGLKTLLIDGGPRYG
jgi:hypothetical protein